MGQAGIVLSAADATGCLETYREQEAAAQSCGVNIRYIRFYSAKFQ